MAESKEKKLGRLCYDLHLIGVVNYERQQNLHTPTAPGDSQADYIEGYKAQQLTTYKNSVRRLFKDTNHGNVLNVGNASFTIYMPAGMGTYTIDAGIVSKVYMGAFPYVTTVTVHRPGGRDEYYANVGSPEFV